MNFLIRQLQLDLVPTSPRCAILMLRIALGVQMLLGHGWGKLMSFSEKAATFPDPLGVGHTTSMALAVFGEVVCWACGSSEPSRDWQPFAAQSQWPWPSS